MSYQQAEDIFAKKNYKDPPMRGRQSMNPLVKLGMIHIDEQKIIHLTDVGMKLYKKEISWGDFVLDSLLKYQLPNETTEGYATWNIKPFIGILHLIKEVNSLCVQRGLKAKGISDPQKYFEDQVKILNAKVPHYKAVKRVKLRDVEFQKNTSRKITRFNIDKTID